MDRHHRQHRCLGCHAHGGGIGLGPGDLLDGEWVDDRLNIRVPVRDVRLPLRDVKLPVHHVRVLVHDVKLPVHHVRVLVRDVKLPVHDARAPVHDVQAPVHNGTEPRCTRHGEADPPPRVD